MKKTKRSKIDGLGAICDCICHEGEYPEDCESLCGSCYKPKDYSSFET